MSKNYLAYLLLVLAALFWSGNFIVGKFATLFEIPPLTLNVFRWLSVWLILMPFTYKEIYNNLQSPNYIYTNDQNLNNDIEVNQLLSNIPIFQDKSYDLFPEFSKIFDERYYFLGKIGRYKINKRLNLKISQQLNSFQS